MNRLVTVGITGSLLALLSGCSSPAVSNSRSTTASTSTKQTSAPASTAVTNQVTSNTASTSNTSPTQSNTTDTTNSSDSQSFLASSMASNDPLAPAYFQVTPQAAQNALSLAQMQGQGQPNAQTILDALEMSAFKADQAADQSISLTSYNGPQISTLQVSSTSTLPIVINIECNGFTDKSQVQPFVTWLTHFTYSLNQWMFHNKQMQAIEGFTLPFPSKPGEYNPGVLASTYVWLQNTDGSNLEINYANPAILNTPFTSGQPIRQPEVFLFGVGRMPNYPVAIGQQASITDIEKMITDDITWPNN